MDKRARDPLMHAPLCISDDDKGDDYVGIKWIFNKVQSRENCSIMKVLVTAETKQTYTEDFFDFFGFLRMLGKEGLAKSAHGEELK